MSNKYYESYVEMLQERAEWKSMAIDAVAHLSRFIEHLLKIKYSTDNECIIHWQGEAKNFRNEAIKDLKWKTNKQNTNSVNYVTERFQNVYNDAKDEYEEDRKTDKSLPYIRHILPDDCPYTLEEILNSNDFELLLDKLPDLEG